MHSRFTGVSYVALATMLAMASTSFAQDRSEDRAIDALTDRILVEGTKKAGAEAVQSVPIAVTAYGEDQLDALFFTGLGSLNYTIPNVQFEDIGTIPGTANFVIRGVGVNSSIPSIDPAVATVVDGVPLAINTGVIFDNFDLQAVEVLRGPQGTLFGRNATAGAVVLRTTDPTEEFEATGKASIESGLRYTASGRVSGPLVDGLVQGKLAAYYSADEGYWDVDIDEVPAIPGVFPGVAAQSIDNVGGRDTFLLRPALRFTPSDTVEIITKAEYGQITGEPNPSQNRGLNGDSFDLTYNNPGDFDADWFQLTNEVNIDVAFGDGVITNVTGYRDYTSEVFGDIDAGPLTIFDAFNLVEHEQFTTELRYAGRFFDRADVTVGFFYLSDELGYVEDRDISSSPSLPFLGGGVQERTSFSVFAQTDIDLTDRWGLTLGGRFNDEEKEAGVTRTFASTGCTRSGCTSFDFPAGGGLDSVSFDNFSPKVGVQYLVNDDVQVYASYTEAVRAGGYNFRNTSPVAPIAPTDDEKIQSIELGFKGEFYDGRLRVNGAVFNYELTDLQREINESDPVVQVVQQIVNTADATIQGVELEVQAVPTENLILIGHVGLTDGEYDEVVFDLTGDGVINERDLALDIPRLAPQTYGFTAIYDHSMGSLGFLTGRASFNHRSRAKYTDNNLGTLPAADIVDASLAYEPVDGGWTLSVYGKNLLDEVTFGNDTQLPATLPGSATFPIPALQGTGATFSPINKGRIFGVEAQFTY